MMPPHPDDETCLKPIGPIAQAIEAMSMVEYLYFMVAISKLSATPTKLGEPIVIGKND